MTAEALRIFVSSPGDVGEERVMTERVDPILARRVRPIDQTRTDTLGTRAHAGHPSASRANPAAFANAISCVCLLWSRLGTRLPADISAEGKTGTEWEFEEAARSYRGRQNPPTYWSIARRKVAGQPERRNRLTKRKDGQFRALVRFLKTWFESEDGTFKAVYKTFEALDQFEDMLERDLRKLIQERLKLTPGRGENLAPRSFPGLEAFDFEHAPIFFGRTRAIGAIREALVQQAARGSAFVLVFGMSGVGKSSLVRAGLLTTITRPGVIEGVGLWRWCVLRPSDTMEDLCDRLASVLMAPSALPELAEADVDVRTLAKLLREAPELAALPLSVGIKRAADTVAAAERLLRPPVTRLALVVDQMEELFSLERVNEQQRVCFVRALSAPARSGHVWVIATMRSDFYPRCAELPDLATLKAGAGQFDLLPPTAPELAQMIGNPARAAGVRFEERATGEKLDDTFKRRPCVTRKHCRCWSSRWPNCMSCARSDASPSEPVVLTFAAYEQLGGMEGALARRAEEEYAKLPPDVKPRSPRCSAPRDGPPRRG